MRHYWMAYCNDGVELSGIERETRSDAINDCKQAFRFDFAECGENPGFEYYIEECHEMEDEILIVREEYFKMTMGPRGGVKCQKIRMA